MRNLTYSGVAHTSPATKQMHNTTNYCSWQVLTYVCAEEFYDEQTWVYTVVDNWNM
jgi:hypothetical protein